MNEFILPIWQSPENRRLIDFQMCGTTYPDKRYVIRRPQSPIACIEYVQSGSGVIHADGQSHLVGAGDAYFLQPGQDQYYHADPEDPWTKHFLNLSGPLLDRLVEGYRLKEHVCFPSLDIQSELAEILSLTQRQPGDNTAELVCIVTRIFQKMYARLTADARYDGAAYRIRELLDRTAAERFNFAAVCVQVALSPSHCIRVFRQAYGVTPHAYFLERKLALAKNLLRNTRLPIKRIAHDLSFADEYYFSNVFKQKVGVTPRAYRMQDVERPET